MGERGWDGGHCGARLMSKEHDLTSHGRWKWVLRPPLTPWEARAGGQRAEFHLLRGARRGDWWKIAGHAAQFGVDGSDLLAWRYRATALMVGSTVGSASCPSFAALTSSADPLSLRPAKLLGAWTRGD